MHKNFDFFQHLTEEEYEEYCWVNDWYLIVLSHIYEIKNNVVKLKTYILSPAVIDQSCPLNFPTLNSLFFHLKRLLHLGHLPEAFANSPAIAILVLLNYLILSWSQAWRGWLDEEGCTVEDEWYLLAEEVIDDLQEAIGSECR